MYDVMLFCHITGVVLLSVAVAVEIIDVVRLLGARDVAAARSALATVRLTDRLAPISSVIVIVFGLGMAGMGGDHPKGTPKEFSFGAGWLVTVYIAFAIMLAVGPGVNGKRLAAIATLAESTADGSLTPELQRARRDPLLSFTVPLGACTILLALFEMTNKPKGAANVIAAAVALVIAAGLQRVWQQRAGRESAAVIPQQATTDLVG